MYGISKDLEVNESNYFDAGIHGGVKIEKICLENSKKDGTGKQVLAFHFKGPKGENYRHVEWPIDSSDAKAESKVTNMSKRIKHILTKFVPEENVLVGNVSSFEEYAAAIIKIAGNNFAGKEFAVKMVYDDKGNLGFPKYVGFIANNVTDLKIGNNDKVTKPTPTPTANTEAFAPTEDKF